MLGKAGTSDYIGPLPRRLLKSGPELSAIPGRASAEGRKIGIKRQRSVGGCRLIKGKKKKSKTCQHRGDVSRTKKVSSRKHHYFQRREINTTIKQTSEKEGFETLKDGNQLSAINLEGNPTKQEEQSRG